VLALFAFLPVAVVSDVSRPPSRVAGADASEQLVALLRAGEHADYVVEYAFTRVRPDDKRRLSWSLTEARYGAALISRGSDALTVQLPKVSYRCQLVERQSSCMKRDEPAPVARSELIGTAVDTGAYHVAPAPAAVLAGERAECFVVGGRVAGNELPGLGRETAICVAADGIPLRSEIASTLSTDTWEARRVQRNIGRTALGPILRGYDAIDRRLPR
jgi:hypothetical protein